MFSLIKKVNFRLHRIYRDKDLLYQQKAKLLFYIVLFAALGSGILILFSLEYNIALFFMSLNFILSILTLILLFKGYYPYALASFWIICLKEYNFFIQPDSPEIIIIPELCVISFALIIVSNKKWHQITTLFLLTGISIYRILSKALEYELNSVELFNHVAAYTCVLVLFALLYIISGIIDKSFKIQKKELDYLKKIKHVNNDLNNKKIILKKLKSDLYRDTLTGLYNRKAFNELFFRDVENNKLDNNDFVVVYIDLDQLKYINDNYEHTTGDKYLKLSGKLFLEFTRDIDSVFRIGGDEFIILFNSCSPPQVETIMNRITHELEIKSMEILNGIQGSFSYGIVSNDESRLLDVKQIIRVADRRMMEHKKSRKITRGSYRL